MDEKALYKITYGLYVVSAEADGQRGGCVVNTLQQACAAFCGGEQGQFHLPVDSEGRPVCSRSVGPAS